MSAAVRLYHLALQGPGSRTLAKAEAHGKREDYTSKMRQISNDSPLVVGGLNLEELYEKHMKGVRLNAGAKKPVIHAVCQWPVGLPVTPKNQQAMLKYSIEFMNSRLGGNAVFAARLDCDESGKHTVDVFCTPTYDKTTRKGVTRWASTSKHLKELAERHRAEIEARFNGKFTDNLRGQGIALQSEFRNYLEAQFKMKLLPKKLKTTPWPDRLEPEAFKKKKDLEKSLAAAKADAKELAEHKNEAIIERQQLQELWDSLCEQEKRLDGFQNELNAKDDKLREWQASLYDYALHNGIEQDPPEPDDDYRP